MWKEEEHPRNSDDGTFKKKMSPLEKIASINIDFDKDNILPELENSTLGKIGTKENRKVLLKKSIIARNEEQHSDVRREDYNTLIGKALYSTQEVRKGKNDKGTYYSLLSFVRYSKKKGDPIYATVSIDIVPKGEYFEIVHFHWVRKKNLPSI